jgi:DNA-binding NarL/FixJ family response regulator
VGTGADTPAAAAAPSVLLVETHGVVADGLALLLETAGCPVTALVSASDVAKAVRAVEPDVVVVGVHDDDALIAAEGLRSVRDEYPHLPVVALCSFANESRADLALGSLLPTTLTADSHGEAFVEVVFAVSHGRSMGERTPVGAGGRGAVDRLTQAELRVLGELARNPDTRARLARRLGVSPSTLDTQLASIKQKVVTELSQLGELPQDGFLSTEALIGWAIDQGFRRSR